MCSHGIRTSILLHPPYTMRSSVVWLAKKFHITIPYVKSRICHDGDALWAHFHVSTKSIKVTKCRKFYHGLHMTTNFVSVGENQSMHSFVLGVQQPCLQGTSERVGSPSPFISAHITKIVALIYFCSPGNLMPNVHSLVRACVTNCAPNSNTEGC